MKPLRILLLTNRISFPLHDGGALAMDAMVRGYHDAGLEVHVLAMNTTRHFVPQTIVDGLYPQIHGFEAVAVNNDVKAWKVLQNLLFSKLPEHVQRFVHPAYAEKLKSLLESFRPDVVQVESPFLSAYLPLITHAQRVLRVHNVEYQIWERFGQEKKGVKGIYFKELARRMRRYEAQIWKEYDLLLPITEVDAQAIRAIHPHQKMLIAPYGIEVFGAPSVFPNRFLKAYHIGAMDWMPNAAAVTWMLETIWPKINAVLPAAEFHFGGRNMPDQFLNNLPQQAFCHREVMDLTGFYKDKEVLLVPLRAGGGIRIKILEAMALGKLVISTAIGMQGIEAAAGVHYLEANTPEEFTQQFLWAKEHPTEAQTICIKALQLIKGHYSNEAIVRRIVEILERNPINGIQQSS